MIALMTTSGQAVPVLDFAALDLQALGAAAQELGAFLLAVDAATLDAGERLLALSRRFFALPQAELAAIGMVHSPYFRGYNPAGSELTQGRPDLREQLDVAPELPPLPIAPDDPPYRRLQGPNQWPAALPELGPAVLDWMDRLGTIAAALVPATFAALGRENVLANAFAPHAHTRLKIIRYPGVADDAGQGVGEHSDSGVLTLILADHADGVQIVRDDGVINVDAVRGTLFVVLGRSLATATGGTSTAARHRVFSPPEGRERYSIPFFFSPRLDYQDYGASALEVLVRSHPDVVRRHHPDLLACSSSAPAAGRGTRAHPA